MLHQPSNIESLTPISQLPCVRWSVVTTELLGTANNWKLHCVNTGLTTYMHSMSAVHERCGVMISVVGELFIEQLQSWHVHTHNIADNHQLSQYD